MAAMKKARKATAKKKTTKRVARKKSGGAASVNLPATLGQYVKRIDKGLNTLERDLAKAQASARRQGTRLLRDASRYVGKLEHWGEVRWRRLTRPYQRDAAKLLARVEAAVGLVPAAKSRGKKKATRKKATTRKTAKKKAAKKKATKRR